MSTAITAEPGAIQPATLLSDDEYYEIIDGQRVELPPMSLLATLAASDLQAAINIFGKQHKLGQGVMETLFQLPPPVNRLRRPDVAFVSFQRWAADRSMSLKANAWEVVPDLAIEVISPSDLMDEVLEKIEEYFRVGVLQVWVIYPHRRMAQIYDSMLVVRGLTAENDLVGGTILPGFSLPLKSLLREE
jgi:Uma2 family endonuclease